MEQQLAAGFLTRLLSNPALQGLSPLQKEEQILQFLQVNAPALQPTLSSPSFFPGKPWPQIVQILQSTLRQIVDSLLLKELERWIHSEIDFTFISFIQDYRIPLDKCRGELLETLQKALSNPGVRYGLAAPLAALQHRLPHRYIDQSYERREYVHFELTKVQRLRMSKEEVKSMVDASLLLRPLIGLMAAGQAPLDNKQRVSGLVEVTFAQKTLDSLKRQLKFVPEALLRSAINSSVSFLDDNRIEATARIAAIFAMRALTYKPGIKVDRGADSPDKSWLRTARRNAKVYGFDVKMLDEFFKIAADSSW